MSFFFLLFFSFCYGSLLMSPYHGGSVISRDSEEHFINVPIDHENPSVGSFPLRYWINKKCFKAATGDIELHLGQEAPEAAPGCRNVATGNLHDDLSVQVEHRMYGKSVPRNSLAVTMMPYLTVEQALADHVVVVDHVQQLIREWNNESTTVNGEWNNNESNNVNGPRRRTVVAYGGSYSGGLSSWLRATYPTHVDASVSLSGVVNAILNYTQFDQAIVDVLSAPCLEASRLVTSAFERLFDNAETRPFAFRIMNATNLSLSPFAEADFFYMIADGAAEMVQYGLKTDLCQQLQQAVSGNGNKSDQVQADADQEVARRFAAAIAKAWGPMFGSQCFYDSNCVRLTVTGDNQANGAARSWRWQKCTQLGYLQPGYHQSLRSSRLTLPLLLRQCLYYFQGAPASFLNLLQRNQQFQRRFGGAQPKATKTFYLNWSDDPWRTASLQDPALSAQCFTRCQDCGHCGAGVKNLTATPCWKQMAKQVSDWANED